MSALDISRFLDQPAKNYSGVVRVQGAVITDSDENERDLIARRGFRDVLTDAIGANGTPNDGFKVTAVTLSSGSFDLQLAAGSFFLGGIRFDAAQAFTLKQQIDWLQFDAMHGIPKVPGSGDDAAHLVWLEAWEQSVSAREDSELLELALNGVDTSGRVRRMARVHATPTPHASCVAAFEALVAQHEAEGASFEPQTGRLTGTTRLRVQTDVEDSSDDLCAPRSEGGYLGADNETIRVQIVEPGRFIWGWSNASPLYRVKAENYTDDSGTSRRQIRMLSLPWDQVAQPKVGDVVEILRWSAQLPNQEKVAQQSGFFARVSRSWQRSDNTLIIEEPLDAAWHDWLSDPSGGQPFQSSHDEGENKTYLYMRVWRGSVFEAEQRSIPFTPGVAVELPRTGLSLTFDAQGRAGDYWIFSVRPNTPHVIMPWSFQSPEGELPTGPVRYLAALAHINWEAANADGSTPKIDDCRRRFRPLSHASSCCEVTVGDGVHSHGDLRSIQDAIDLLPAEGGKVCVLKGTYTELVTLDRRKNITLEGCGVLSRLRLPAEANRTLIGINSCQNITLRALALSSPDEVAITITTDPTIEAQDVVSRDIVLERLSIEGRDAAAVFASPVERFVLANCDLRFEGLPQPVAPVAGEIGPGQMPGVVLGGRDLNVLHNRIGTTEARVAYRPFGGVHVLSGSEMVRIQHNSIRQIGGLGVALGSWTLVEASTDGSVGFGELGFAAQLDQSYSVQFSQNDGQRYTVDRVVIVTDDGCPQADPDPIPPSDDPDAPKLEVDTGAPLERVQIRGNEIADTGLSGIGVHRFFDLERFSAVISVRGLEICQNKLLRNAQYELPLLSGSAAVHAAHGGITLGIVDSASIVENVISDAGGNDLDPYCGIFILKANGVSIERNTITENGGERVDNGPVRLGQRGGVVIGLASAPQHTVSHAGGFGVNAEYSLSRQPAAWSGSASTLKTFAGNPALRVHDNIVVQPDGRALQCVADGPISVCNNQLVSRGAAAQSQWLALLTQQQRKTGAQDRETLARVADTFATDVVAALVSLLGGLCVNLWSIPGSAEWSVQLGMNGGNTDPSSNEQGALERFLLYRGEVMLNDNQIVFDAKGSTQDLGFSSISVFGADDASICNNQCQLDLLPGDMLGLAHLFALSVESVRVSNNYVKQLGRFDFGDDGPGSGLRAIYSASLVNTTSLNHHSGQIEAQGLRTAIHGNLSLML